MKYVEQVLTIALENCVCNFEAVKKWVVAERINGLNKNLCYIRSLDVIQNMYNNDYLEHYERKDLIEWLDSYIRF